MVEVGDAGVAVLAVAREGRPRDVACLAEARLVDCRFNEGRLLVRDVVHRRLERLHLAAVVSCGVDKTRVTASDIQEQKFCGRSQ